jgi:hypothetical protein
MKKVARWTAGGLALAIACGLGGLHHLSATVFTLTVFCAWPAILFYVLTWLFGVSWSLPDRIAAWAEPTANVAVGGKREGEE